jgi:hypothetical protein
MKLDEIPVPGEFWKDPEPKKTGDQEPDAIYRAVGEFLSKWESLEQTFAFLFQRFVEGSHAAKRAYGAITANQGRRKAIEAAAEAYFVMDRPARKDLRDRFDRLMTHFEKAASKRNNIAHAIVSQFSADGVPHGSFLIPPEYNSNKTNLFPDPKKAAVDPLSVLATYRFTSADIREFTERVVVFQTAAMEYATHGWEWDLKFQMKKRIGG